MATQKSATLFGATGLIGRHLLLELLDSTAYAEVTAVVRRDTGIRHVKLKQLFADYRSVATIKDRLIGDDIFCCLGTTRKKTPDRNEYYHIDHDYPVAVANYTKQNGATAFFLVSALGADVESGNFYLRTKGETERDIAKAGFKRLDLFRPSLLLGERRENRPLETIGKALFILINPLLISPLSKYRAISAAAVAKAICCAAAVPKRGLHSYYWTDMKQLL